ncbi:MAG TPA: hypothetical protein EYP98_22180, partial [Planctomycetes bacterium]|nr:hypothetical protein [Planctomycetota bacterium]
MSSPKKAGPSKAAKKVMGRKSAKVHKAAAKSPAGKGAARKRATDKSGNRKTSRVVDSPVGGSRRIVKARAAGTSGAGRAGTVTAKELCWTCPPLKPSKKAPSAAFLLGQDRAMAALRTGLSIHAQGYNIFVSGLIGSGRT